jgi:hypothetical protein
MCKQLKEARGENITWWISIQYRYSVACDTWQWNRWNLVFGNLLFLMISSNLWIHATIVLCLKCYTIFKILIVYFTYKYFISILHNARLCHNTVVLLKSFFKTVQYTYYGPDFTEYHHISNSAKQSAKYLKPHQLMSLKLL